MQKNQKEPVSDAHYCVVVNSQPKYTKQIPTIAYVCSEENLEGRKQIRFLVNLSCHSWAQNKTQFGLMLFSLGLNIVMSTYSTYHFHYCAEQKLRYRMQYS